MLVQGWSWRYREPGRRSRSGERSRPGREGGPNHLRSRWPDNPGTHAGARCCNGTVNLIGLWSRQDTRRPGTRTPMERLCPSGHAGDRGPGLEGLGSGGPILAGGEVIAAEVEEIVDPVMGGEEALGLAS